MIFRDEGARRWLYVLRIGAACAAACVVVVAIFWMTVERAVAAARAPASSLPSALGDATIRFSRLARTSVPMPVKVTGSFVVSGAPSASDENREGAPLVPEFPERVAWLDELDPPAVRSLESHAERLTDVVLAGLHLDDSSITLAGGVPDGAVAFAQGLGLNVWEALDDRGRRPSLTLQSSQIPDDTDLAESLALSVDARLAADGAYGVVLDLEEDDMDVDGNALQRIVRELALRLHESGRSVGVAIDGSFEPESLRDLADMVDMVFLRAHVQPDPQFALGPVAPRAWFRATVTAAKAVVPREKLVVALPTRPASWSARIDDLSPGEMRSLSWSDVMARAAVAGVRPVWQPWAANALVVLPGSEGVGSTARVRAEVDESPHSALVSWLADGATFADEVVWLRREGLSSVGIDEIGGEDPRIWRVLEAGARREAIDQALSTLVQETPWQIVGDGVAMTPIARSTPGSAKVSWAADGSLTDEVYRDLPRSPTIVRRAPVLPRTVALTFDDGPSAEFTPLILDILRDRHVRATFFLVGARVEREPELVKRMVAEGHEIGNHSFYHPDLAEIPARRAELEIGATNLLLGAVTGRTTCLFRPPFRADDAPSELADALALEAGERLGMSNVVSTVDPRDWELPGEEAIVRSVMADVERDGGGVVLLHDGGGDRGETVRALGPLVDALQKEGFRFVQIHDLFGHRDIDIVNPPVVYQLGLEVNRAVWWTGTWGLRGLQIVALVALIVAAVRHLSLMAGALLECLKRRGWQARLRRELTSVNRVSVVIPAYNEGKVIARTIRSVLASRHVDIELIVVNDGSTDDTAEVVEREFGGTPLRFFNLANRGKAAALNFGFRRAKNDIVVALDADTIFLPDTIAELGKGFDSPEVAAVAGRAVVGNPHGFLGRCQALEYAVGQAIERRAWHFVGVVSVVPGAVGAWRRQAVLSAGGFGTDTLAEDCDLTIELQRRGWRVAYEPNAVALTEAPETLAALLKQRFRWSFGVLQTAWKHRASMWRPQPGCRRVGLLLLPTMLSCHLCVPLFAPLADLAAAIAVYLGYGRSVLAFVFIQLAAEIVLVAAACFIARPSWRVVWDWPVQRFVYRWILFVPLFRAVMAALHGRAVGWGKLMRTGTVHAPYEKVST